MNLIFDNKSCTGTSLHAWGQAPKNLRAILNQSHTLYLLKDGGSFLAFGDNTPFEDCGFMIMQFASSANLQTLNTGRWLLCSNIVRKGNYTVRNYVWDFSTKKIEILLNTGQLYTWDFEITAAMWSGHLIGINLTADGVVAPVVGNTTIFKITNKQVTQTTDYIGNNYGYINACLNSDGTMSYTTSMSNYVRTGIKLYNDMSRSNLYHFYQCSEGADYYCYDVAGTAHAKIFGSSRNASRALYTHTMAYNAINGFKQDSDQSTAIIKAKIPINRDLIIYKSCFTHNIDDCQSTSKPVLSYKNGKLVFTPTRAINNLGINYPGSYATVKSIGRHFRLKTKFKNNTNYTLRIQSIYFWSGNFLTTYGLGISSPLVNIAPGEEYYLDTVPTITTNSPVAVAPYTTYYSFTLLNVATGALTDNTTQNIEFSDIELTQTDYTEEFPAIKDGKNASESTLYFTGTYNTNYIPEYNQRWTLPANPLEGTVQSSPNMGADVDGGWDITSKQTANIVKGSWRMVYDYIYYLKNHDTNDLPEGVSYGVDMKMSQPIGYSAANGFLADMCKVNSSGGILTNPIWNNRWYKFKIHVHFWYKLKELTTIGRLMAGVLYDRAFEIWNKDIPDTNWHYFDKTIDFNISVSTMTSIWATLVGISWMGWPDNTTQADSLADSSYYVGSIADFRYEITPNDYSYEPIYFKKDFEKNSISNIVVYDWPQKGDNLKRVINWVNNKKEIEIP